MTEPEPEPELAKSRWPRCAPRVPRLRPGLITYDDVHRVRTAQEALAHLHREMASAVAGDPHLGGSQAISRTPNVMDPYPGSGPTYEWHGARQADLVTRIHVASNALRAAAASVVARHLEASLVWPPDPADHTPNDGCPTWWLTMSSAPLASRILAIESVHIGLSDLVMPERYCSLPGQHAGPHVDLTSGDVRLGHEDELAHVPYAAVEVPACDVLRALGVTTRSPVITHADCVVTWTTRYAVRHDHRTCGWCPADVW